jgi:hypothetical protein
VDAVIVTRPTSVVRLSACTPTWPSVMPIATKTIENSLICATVSPAMKPVRRR